MRIFKFGGASVKDADSIKNVVSVLQTVGYEDTLVVISAMGKMTNAFETVVSNYFNNKSELKASIAAIYSYHETILDGLFSTKNHSIYTQLKSFLA